MYWYAGTVCRLIDVKDPIHCTALETAAGGRVSYIGIFIIIYYKCSVCHNNSKKMLYRVEEAALLLRKQHLG